MVVRRFRLTKPLNTKKAAPPGGRGLSSTRPAKVVKQMQARSAPKSAEFQYWKARDLGPTERERRILRRIEASGGLRLTYETGGVVAFVFGDGRAVSAEFRFTAEMFDKFWALGWLTPDPRAPGLFEDLPAQIYLAGAWR